MRNLKRRLTVILTAALMTFSLAGTVSAEDNVTQTAAEAVPAAESKYTGWKLEDGFWYYYKDGEMNKSSYLKIDGTVWDFSFPGTLIGKYSGSLTESGKSRYYKDGLPADGWIESNKEKRYCLDGYPVKGEFPVDGTLYKFDGKGVYTDKNRTPAVSVTCGERVCADEEKLTFTIENLDGKSHDFKIAKSFEYLKNGEWVGCKNGKVQYAPLKGGLSQKGEKLSFEVSTKEYSKNKFAAGFYRLPVQCGTETHYAVFEAVRPFELKSKKEEYIIENYYGYNRNYSASPIEFDLTVNSSKKEMQAENIAGSVSVKIERQTENGWENVENVGWVTGYTDDKNCLEVVPEFVPEEGYYRAAVTAGGTSCTEYFFISYLTAEAWLDEYDLNNNDLTVCFTVQNLRGEPLKICSFIYQLYKKENGEWKYIDNDSLFEISEDSYKTLNVGYSMAVNFDISDWYDVSKLEAGEYAADIGGVGFGEFTLTDKPKEKNLPFKDLKAKDVKQIIINDNAWEITQRAVISAGNSKTKVTDITDENGWREITAYAKNSDWLDRSIAYLRQFEINGVYKNYDDSYVGGSSSITIVYNDGTKKELFFYTGGAVRTDGKWYHCGKYVLTGFMDIVGELAARNLPFEDIYNNEPVKILLEKVDGNRIITAELNMDNYDDLHSQVVSTYYFELKEVREAYEVFTGGVFQVTFVYEDGTEKRIAFFEPDIVLMPDGKYYRCRDRRYYDSTVKMFDSLEHTVKNILPDDTLTEDTT